MKYFFLGICGISMRSLAVMLRLRGDEVSGCDAEPSDLDFFKTYIDTYNIEEFYMENNFFFNIFYNYKIN